MGGLQVKYLRLCCCICDFLYFNMQHDLVLKMLNCDLLTARVRGGGSVGKIFRIMLLQFVILFNLICNITML